MIIIKTDYIKLVLIITCVHGKSLQLCLTLCNPMDCSPPGSSVHGILQARMWEWVALLSSRDLLNPGIKPVSLTSPALAGSFFTTEPPGKLLQQLLNNHEKLKSKGISHCRELPDDLEGYLRDTGHPFT